jgi:hypothetical protein
VKENNAPKYFNPREFTFHGDVLPGEGRNGLANLFWAALITSGVRVNPGRWRVNFKRIK